MTRTRLADGRELLYFDDVPGLDRSAGDRRELPPYAPTGERRHDALHGEDVVIAASRQNRTYHPGRAECPLCPGQEIPAPGYHVAVFENRFPSLGGPAGGRCEVVGFSADHGTRFSALPAERLATVGRAWAQRTVELGARADVAYVFAFENRGAAVGATLPHPHGQIYAYPFVPAVPARVRAAAQAHRAKTGGCLLCALIAEELAGPRVVATTPGAVAYVPYAARWPYEVYVAPRACLPGLAEMGEEPRLELIGLYADVLRRFEALYAEPAPYMACWYQHTGGHLYARVFTPQRTADKLKFLASSESGAGAFLTDVLPESAAAALRDR